MIGAGSVISKDCAPHSLYVGNPAVKIKDRGDLRLLPIPLDLEVENMRELPKITTLEGFLAAAARILPV